MMWFYWYNRLLFWVSTFPSHPNSHPLQAITYHTPVKLVLILDSIGNQHIKITVLIRVILGVFRYMHVHMHMCVHVYVCRPEVDQESFTLFVRQFHWLWGSQILLDWLTNQRAPEIQLLPHPTILGLLIHGATPRSSYLNCMYFINWVLSPTLKVILFIEESLLCLSNCWIPSGANASEMMIVQSIKCSSHYPKERSLNSIWKPDVAHTHTSMIPLLRR